VADSGEYHSLAPFFLGELLRQGFALGNVRNPHQNPVGGQKTVHHLGKLIGDLQFAFQEIENHIAVGLALEQKFNTLGEIFAISFGFEQQGANVGAGYLPPEKIRQNEEYSGNTLKSLSKVNTACPLMSSMLRMELVR
jgi:hypothetical protein